MKQFILLLCLILPVQLFVPIYELQLAIWVVSGLIIAFKFNFSYIFWKVFLLEMFIALGLFYVFNTENSFIGEILTQLKLPSVMSVILFLLINSITIGFVFQIGSSLQIMLVGKRL